MGSTLINEQLKEIQSNGSAPKNVTSAKPRSDADQSVFCVYKGVKCFDFSKSLNVLATGGKKTGNLLSFASFSTKTVLILLAASIVRFS